MPLFDFPEKFFRDSVLRVLCKEKVKRYCLLGHAMNKKNIKNNQWQVMIHVPGELITNYCLCLLGGTSIAIVVNMDIEHEFIKWFSMVPFQVGESLLTCQQFIVQLCPIDTSTELCNLLSLPFSQL